MRRTWDSTANAEEFFSSQLTFIQRAGTRSRLIDETQPKKWQQEDQVTYLSQPGQDLLLVLASDEETVGLLLTIFPAL